VALVQKCIVHDQVRADPKRSHAFDPEIDDGPWIRFPHNLATIIDRGAHKRRQTERENVEVDELPGDRYLGHADCRVVRSTFRA